MVSVNMQFATLGSVCIYVDMCILLFGLEIVIHTGKNRGMLYKFNACPVGQEISVVSICMNEKCIFMIIFIYHKIFCCRFLLAYDTLNVCVWVHMYSCMHICVHVCVYACTHVIVQTCVCM